MKEEYLDELIEALTDGIMDSGVVRDGDIAQLAMNLAGDTKNILVECDETQLPSDLQSLYDNGLGENKVKDMVRDIYFERKDMAMLIHRELSYWISHGSNKS